MADYRLIIGVRASMIRRCHEPKDKNYDDYGGRGICVCQEWRDSPLAFVKWAVGNGWSRGLQIDREDNEERELCEEWGIELEEGNPVG